MKVNKNAPLKVLFIVNRLYEWSQNFITRELTELNELGVDMAIAARDMAIRDDLSPKEKKLADKYFRIANVPFSPAYLFRHLIVAVGRPQKYLDAWRTLFSLKHKPSKFFRGVICLFRAAGLVKFAEQNRFNLIHAHFLTAAGETTLYLSKFTGIPFGATAYAMDIYVDNSGLVGKLRNAAYVNGTTKFNERSMAKLVPEHPERIVTKYYGIPTSETMLSPIEHEKFTFIAVGRLVEKKGFKYMVEACAELKKLGFDFQCKIIGKGPLEAELKAQIQSLGLENMVTFPGYIAPNEMSKMYRSGDVLVAPCVVAANGDVDGLPNVCLEAMDCGLPIISTTISGIPEGVEDGVNGWLIPPNNSAALAEAMKKAITAPNPIDMRIASHRMASEKFNVKKNVLRIKDLLEEHYLR
ncbi:MAG: glycosyltransferase [Saprospiraceae bacterium]|nr:glycosyltransferase [Saprospiraceae bacterium]MCF8250771.1 glycosyltransferase [Saprospiraceae bacterium]MCF8282183.1 glycosyltransferase [Bacteroidales bacterium]MCF8312572.1 glycosyltransferase [Saprospiraceae bacterium]MCF8440901.1 glycosyltransferase [Saprospiraceae bacterium]